MRICFLALLFSISYLASSQKFEYAEPKRLGNQINSKAEEMSPILSPDGKTLYFARVLDPANNGGELGGMDIWISTKGKDGLWSQSSNKRNNWNNEDNNAVIGINKNGTIVYLLNAYDRGNGISFSKLLNGSWTDPERISIPGINQNDIGGCHMNSTFDVLLLSMIGKKSMGQEDIFVSLKDSLGKWKTPINLGSSINTAGFEISPYLSEDKKRIYFSSNGHAGYGDADIFVSERLYNTWTIWSKPKNLGNKINSMKFDSYFSIHGDTTCFFSSNRDTDLSDIYLANVLITKMDTIPLFPKQVETKYLTDLEIKEIGNYELDTKLTFEPDSVILSGKNLEKLKELSKILFLKKDIKIRLTAKKSLTDNELEINQKRLFNVLQFLKSLGIEGSRITFGSETSNKTIIDHSGLISIKLYQ